MFPLKATASAPVATLALSYGSASINLGGELFPLGQSNRIEQHRLPNRHITFIPAIAKRKQRSAAKRKRQDPGLITAIGCAAKVSRAANPQR
jgi:hypothetical protein